MTEADRTAAPSVETLASTLTIDITTIGRRSGKPARIEIWWFRVDGRFIIAGTPGPRDWYANLVANDRIVVHVDGHDLVGTATPVSDPEIRRAFFTDAQTSWYSDNAGLEALVAHGPMVEVRLDGYAD